MKLQQGATNIELGLIDIDFSDRQRQDGRGEDKRIIKTDDLEASISRRGLLQPIIVEPRTDAPGRFWLKIGERRLTACQRLGHQKILARKTTDLSPTEAKIIELEENLKRVDLVWQDTIRSVAEIHRLYQGLDSAWTMTDTAQEIGLTQGAISMYMRVEQELAQDRIAKASTVREAYNMLARRDNREAGAALQELLDTPDAILETPVAAEVLSEEENRVFEAKRALNEPIPVEITEKLKARLVPAVPVAVPALQTESILNLSFLDWAPSYSGTKFNLVHCDFPYGIEFNSGPQGRGSEFGPGYKDTADIYWRLVEGLCANLDRVMSVSAHLMFWMSADSDIVTATKAKFAESAPSLKFHKFPLIWQKSDNAGIASDPRHGPRHVYELCLLASRGSRQIVRVKGDSYSAPTDQRLHPSTKPEPMLRHFMEMLVDDYTTLLDPTCGSAASLRAAESLGAKQVLGLEIDQQFVGPAQLALKQARLKRAAEKGGLGLSSL